MMDPDANLDELRKRVAKAQSCIMAGSSLNKVEDDIERACELFEALDNWLSDGGFLPKDWSVGARGPRR